MESSKLLYIDGLNFADYFFERDGSFWAIERARGLVQEFLEAAKNSHFHIEVFIDYGQSTEETKTKWKTRREDDIRLGRLGIMPGIQWVLGQLFIDEGIKVHYSDIDNDDTLAAYAHAHGASILSEDKDFFRYNKHNYRQYKDFEIVKDKLHLRKKGFIVHPDCRDLILDPLPMTYNYFPALEILGKSKEIKRGSPSPLTKLQGNLFGHIKVLRQ